MSHKDNSLCSSLYKCLAKRVSQNKYLLCNHLRPMKVDRLIPVSANNKFKRCQSVRTIQGTKQHVAQMPDSLTVLTAFKDKVSRNIYDIENNENWGSSPH